MDLVRLLVPLLVSGPSNKRLYRGYIDLFNAKSKRVKSSKSSRSVPKWPHPPTFKANLEYLAEAGFYFNPSPEDTDNVACFECGILRGGMRYSEEPFDLTLDFRIFSTCGNHAQTASNGAVRTAAQFSGPQRTKGTEADFGFVSHVHSNSHVLQ